jgi:SAM-dependent methyltransferase
LAVGKKVIFSKFYADCYDHIHANRNYRDESRKLREFITKGKDQSELIKVLDFGCGTGKSLEFLSNSNLLLFGYDRNDEMIDVAKTKNPNLFFTSNFGEVPRHLDCVYSLFDVVSYQVTESEIREFFRMISSKLRPGGKLLIDGWNHSGLKLDPPQVSQRFFSFDAKNISRQVIPSSIDGYLTTILDITLQNMESLEIIAKERHILRAYEVDYLQKIASEFAFTNFVFRDGKVWEENL